jgi:hypothetical protein
MPTADVTFWQTFLTASVQKTLTTTIDRSPNQPTRLTIWVRGRTDSHFPAKGVLCFGCGLRWRLPWLLLNLLPPLLQVHWVML